MTGHRVVRDLGREQRNRDLEVRERVASEVHPLAPAAAELADDRVSACHAATDRAIERSLHRNIAA